MAPIFTRLIALSALFSTGFSLPTSRTKEVDDCNVGFHGHTTLQREMPTVSGLPSNSNATLVYAAVGVGHQNYTCIGTTYVQTGPGDGALAYLYDATEYFSSNQKAITQLPAQRLQQFLHDGQSQQQTDTGPDLRLLGEHFFDALVRPNFNLFAASPPRYLLAAKFDAIAAPSTSEVTWLYLGENTTAGGTFGLNSVYRVQTAGGAAPASCPTHGSKISVPYAAEYWFFD